MKVGDIIESNNFGQYEVLEKIGNKCTIKFFNTNYIRSNCHKKVVTCGGVVDPTGNVSIEDGRILNTTSWGKIIILCSNGTKDIEIKFLNTGNILFRQQKHGVLAGVILDKEEQLRTINEKQCTRKKEVAAYFKRMEEFAALRAEALRIKDVNKKQANEEKVQTLLSKESAQNTVDLLYADIRRVHNMFGEYVLTNKTGRKSWNIKFIDTGNEYKYGTGLIDRNSVTDRLSDRYEEYQKLVSKQEYEDNMETKIAKASQYQKDNLDKVVTRNANRRARRKKAEGSHTLEEVQALAQSQNNLCNCCGSPLIKGNKHLDHIMPLILGGSNYISNLQYLCKFCNLSKNGSHPDDWAIYSESDIFLFALFSRLTEMCFNNQDIL